MQFQDETLEFISTYFFETKASYEDNYQAIIYILGLSIFLPCVTFFVFSYLVYFYSEWIVTYAKKYIADGKKKFHKKRLAKIKDEKNHKHREDEVKEIQSRRVTIAGLILTSLCLSITLFTFHIIASVRLIQYGNEILNDAKPRVQFNVKRKDTDDRGLLIINIVLSFFPTIILICFLLCNFCCRDSGSKNIDEALGKYLRLSLGVLLVYLGFYFSIYMLLAFINDPIVTGFVYLIGILCILCVYLVSYALCLTMFPCLAIASKYHFQYRKLRIGNFISLFIVVTSGFSIGYFITMLIFILTLGNFKDFQAVQNLTLPIIIGLLSVFLFKPLFARIKKSVAMDTTDHDDVTSQNSVETNINGYQQLK